MNDLAVILIWRRKMNREASCKEIVMSLINCSSQDITIGDLLSRSAEIVLSCIFYISTVAAAAGWVIVRAETVLL